MNELQARELIAQIGKMNLWAISGGRVQIDSQDAVVLKVGNGYAVRIILEGDDTYTVQRLWRANVKGEARNVYAEEVGEVAYVASCYVNREFNQAEVA
jgi:hypothetical protein